MSWPSEGRGLVLGPTTMIPSTWRTRRALRWCCSRIWSPRASHRNALTRPVPNAFSAPMRMGIMNRPSRSPLRIPTLPERSAERPFAMGLGLKSSSAAAARMRCLVAGATSKRPLSAFDAVAIDTSARRATSLRAVARPAVPLDDIRPPRPGTYRKYHLIVGAGVGIRYFYENGFDSFEPRLQRPDVHDGRCPQW